MTMDEEDDEDEDEEVENNEDKADGEVKNLTKGKVNQTYILPNNSPQTSQPNQPLASNRVHEEAFTREHRLTQALRLTISRDPLRRSQIRILAHGPLLAPGEAEDSNVTHYGRREQKLARAGVGG